MSNYITLNVEDKDLYCVYTDREFQTISISKVLVRRYIGDDIFQICTMETYKNRGEFSLSKAFEIAFKAKKNFLIEFGYAEVFFEGIYIFDNESLEVDNGHIDEYLKKDSSNTPTP